VYELKRGRLCEYDDDNNTELRELFVLFQESSEPQHNHVERIIEEGTFLDNGRSDGKCGMSKSENSSSSSDTPLTLTSAEEMLKRSQEEDDLANKPKKGCKCTWGLKFSFNCHKM